MELRGRITHTFVRGRPAYEQTRVVARPGDGAFVRP
jgi:hypothetical protein